MGLKKQTKLAIVFGGLIVAMSATAVAMAQSPIDPPATEPETKAPDGHGAKCFGVVEGEFEGELPQELLDELNGEGQALAEAFDAAGIDYQLGTDDEGVTFPEWDKSDAAANQVAEDFFESGVEKGFFTTDVMDLPPELVEELNAEGQELADALDAAGMSYEMVTDPAGVAFPEWDWDDEAANEVAEQFLGTKHGECDDIILSDIDMDLPQDFIDEINADGAALAAALDAAGVSYELITDDHGVTFPEWDPSDEAANAVAEEFFGELKGELELLVP